MKKLILAIILLITFNVSAQIEYPRLEVDSLGQAIVIMTVEQAQQLDNNADLLMLFEKLDGELGKYDEVCIRVIGQKDAVIAVQDLEIKKLKESLTNKDEQITKLQQEVILNEEKNESFTRELAKKDEEIKLHKDEIKRVKVNSVIGGSITSVAIIGLIIALVFK
jgi:peptidoglycan hydrolase CwlO-like protein